MNQSSLFTAATHIIAQNVYMVMATSDMTGQPWVTPVYYAYDGNHFYWYSRWEAKHSQLIAANNRVAVTIYNATDDAVEAVYMSGQAQELSAEQLPDALAVYAKRQYKDDAIKQEQFASRIQDFLGKAPLRMYKFRPQEMSIMNKSATWHGKWLDTRSADVM